MGLDPALALGVAPGAFAIVVSIATFVLTVRRARRSCDRIASKDSVETLTNRTMALAGQNSRLQAEVTDLRNRVERQPTWNWTRR